MPSFRENLIVYLKGMAMGAADTVPGVSGGTIALVVGIYERLIKAVTAIRPGLFKLLLDSHRKEGRKQLYQELFDRDIPFLFVLGAGLVSSVVVLSRLMHAAISSYRAQTFAFFFGLILASAFVLYEHLSFQTSEQILSGLAGFVIAFLVTGATATGMFPNTLPFVFIAGMVAISAMVLPGISGAFILLILGQYSYLTGVLSRFVDSLIVFLTGGGASNLVSLGSVVAVFGAGASIGILTITHVVERMLENHHRATMTFLVSLMLGSLRLPVEEVLTGVETWNFVSGLSIAVPLIVGGAAVLVLDRYTDDLDYN